MKINWSKVLPVVSCTGVAATCGLSFWGGRKYEEKKEEKGKKALLYLIPGLAAAVGSMISIAINKKITGKEIAVLTGSCAYLVYERDKFKEVMKERMVHDGYTPEEAKETLEAVQEETNTRMAAEIVHNGEKFVIPCVEETGHGNLLCIDGWSGRAFRASKEWVEEGIRSFNVLYRTPVILNEGSVNEQILARAVGMCDLFNFWGLFITTMSCEYGWIADQDLFEDVGPLGLPDLGIYTKYVEKPNGYNEPVLFIEYTYGYYPVEAYYEY